MKKVKSKYPPYPVSNRDYAVIMSARSMLEKPNRCICIYCRHQAKTEETLTHAKDCPAKDKE